MTRRLDQRRVHYYKLSTSLPQIDTPSLIALLKQRGRSLI